MRSRLQEQPFLQTPKNGALSAAERWESTGGILPRLAAVRRNAAGHLSVDGATPTQCHEATVIQFGNSRVDTRNPCAGLAGGKFRLRHAGSGISPGFSRA